MRRVRVFLACLVCRAARMLLRLGGRGGTNLPGRLALKLCPDVLETLAAGVDTVLVTGTNGKTTTVKMLCGALAYLGHDVFTNRSGANLSAGITAEYIFNATLRGRARRRLAVIECDEAALKRVSGALQPKAIVVNNLFRDQLDRYGEVTHTLSEIREGIEKAPGAVLCLNADCSLTASLAGDFANPVLFFGAEIPSEHVSAVSDAPRCLRCGERYEYRFHTFAHLGAFYCPACGYARPEPQLSVLSLSATCDGRSEVEFRHGDERFRAVIALPSLYNAYNAAAALTALQALGFSPEQAAPSLADLEAGFGRMETMTVNGTPVRIILVKNPAGCDRALEYLATLPQPWYPIFCLNDKAADGTDVSWIWDADYDNFLAASPEAMAVYGTRAGDMRLRLKYAGAADSSIRVFADSDELLAFVSASEIPVVILPNYTSMLDVRDKLACASGGRRFWK